jgi:hypothetical protein
LLDAVCPPQTTTNSSSNAEHKKMSIQLSMVWMNETYRYKLNLGEEEMILHMARKTVSK